MAGSEATVIRRSALTPARQEQEPSKRNPKTNQREALQDVAGAPDGSSKQGSLVLCTSIWHRQVKCTARPHVPSAWSGPPAETSPTHPASMNFAITHATTTASFQPHCVAPAHLTRNTCRLLPVYTHMYMHICQAVAAQPKERQGSMKQHEGRLAFMPPRDWNRAPTNRQ